ncbi:MAG: ANTAR domain-containing protein [Aestuariivirga sp.]|nr:ANTAR domain-containing protein [Aestuariivirga sp.]
MREDDLSILVVDENSLRARVIEEALREAGYARVVVVHEIAGLVRRIEETAPDVIVIDIENPNRDALESLFQVSRSVQRPIAMFVDHSDRGMIEAAVEAGVSAYIVDGLKKERVKPILDMAIIRFKNFAKLRNERDDAKRALGDRKLIDRAKGILMQQRSMDEPAAYDLMRRAAMEENRRMVEIAQSIVTAAGLLGGKGKQ